MSRRRAIRATWRRRTHKLTPRGPLDLTYRVLVHPCEFLVLTAPSRPRGSLVLVAPSRLRKSPALAALTRSRETPVLTAPSPSSSQRRRESPVLATPAHSRGSPHRCGNGATVITAQSGAETAFAVVRRHGPNCAESRCGRVRKRRIAATSRRRTRPPNLPTAGGERRPASRGAWPRQTRRRRRSCCRRLSCRGRWLVFGVMCQPNQGGGNHPP